MKVELVFFKENLVQWELINNIVELKSLKPRLINQKPSWSIKKDQMSIFSQSPIFAGEA